MSPLSLVCVLNINALARTHKLQHHYQKGRHIKGASESISIPCGGGHCNLWLSECAVCAIYIICDCVTLHTIEYSTYTVIQIPLCEHNHWKAVAYSAVVVFIIIPSAQLLWILIYLTTAVQCVDWSECASHAVLTGCCITYIIGPFDRECVSSVSTYAVLYRSLRAQQKKDVSRDICLFI